MSKSKSKGAKVSAAPDAAVLTKVKDAGVIKPAQTPKAKSKEIAKQVATKSEKGSKHKKVKEPTPEPEPDSDSADSASSVSASASESESESEVEVSTKNGIASVGARAKAGAVDEGKEGSDEDEDDSSHEASGEESASSESSDDEPAAPGVLGAAAARPVVNGTSKPGADSSDESESSDSDNESDEKPAVTKKPTNADRLNKKPAPAVSAKTALGKEHDESEEDEDEENSEASTASSDASSEDEEETEPARAVSKRKAEEEAAPAIKKAKTGPDANNSQGKNLFVGSLSWNVDEEWLTREFEEFGELTGVRIITDRNTGRSKGFGYVEFANAADAAAAHSAKQGADLDGRKLNVDFATSRNNGDQRDKAQSRAKTFGDQTSDPTDTLWIGNISFQVDQDQLSTAFQEFGTVLGVRLPTDRETGALKGFGYVTYSSVDEAKAAMEKMQGADLAGRTLRLDFSQPRQNNGDSPARGGRGGGRGGFGDRGRGGFGGRGGGRGGFGDRGGRGGGRGNGRGGRGGTTNRGGFGDFSGKKTTF